MDNRSNDDADFTDAFCAFLQTSVTTVDAAELLLALYTNRDKAFATRDLLTRLTPGSSVTENEAGKHIDVFQQRGLAVRDPEGRVRYEASPESEQHVQTLSKVYLERPVTLFRVIYALRDTKIRTLADAFKIWGK